ncbi:uncharacterized protein LOC119690184 [Teleopsis dalmanni]|uniref:uncharacterized protein LOC119690184 n=1 Tax=Teleopsis dalmanni TaxID=139649 RepID=UPI0018CC7BE9|nr:uncharacterized protein LOC119690184 [Teleopsis dalmanni]
MKPDTVISVCFALATICACNSWLVSAFVASSPSAQSVGTLSQSTVGKNVAAELMAAYPAATYMNAATGSVSFQPHDSGELNERAVYDPGDELLRALNAEIAASGQDLGTLPEEPDYADTVFNELEVASKFDMLRKLEDDLREEQDIVSKSAVLMKLLEDPTIEVLPLVYVEEDPVEDANNILFPTGTGMTKRSRYYRRYPWKRHNRNRSTYEPELRYACTPTKEDVFKLLVNLHENRKGNHSKTVNFCNRKRPAKAIFTNIRFLG